MDLSSGVKQQLFHALGNDDGPGKEQKGGNMRAICQRSLSFYYLWHCAMRQPITLGVSSIRDAIHGVVGCSI